LCATTRALPCAFAAIPASQRASGGPHAPLGLGPLSGFQDVADFREQQLLLARSRRLGLLCTQQLVHQLDDEKQDQSNDDEVDDQSDETPISENRALLPGLRQ